MARAFRKPVKPIAPLNRRAIASATRIVPSARNFAGAIMQLSDISEYVAAGKNAIDLLKSAYGLLPKGKDRDELERKVREAEDILKRSDAKLAKDLGYELCKCTYPPQIMLYRQGEHAHVCQNEKCGNRIQPWRPSDNEPQEPYDPFAGLPRR